MLLDSADKSIEVVLAAKPVSECPVTSFYVDHIDTWGYPGSYDTATNGVTAVTVVAAPALVPPNATIQRQVKMITVYNPNQASVVVYTQLNHGGTIRIMNMSTLATGCSLVYQNEIGFRVQQTDGSFLSDVTDRVGRLVGRTTFYDTLVNGTIDAINEYVEIDCSGLGSLGIQISNSGGAWVGTLGFYGTVDGTNWDFIRTVQFGGLLTNGTTVNGLFFAQAGGLLKIRVYAIAWTSGACSVYVEGTTATNAVTLANSLPIGTNTIGNVNAYFMDTVGTAYGYKVTDGLPRVEAKNYYTNIGEGKISGHASWMKIGYNGALVAATEADVWSKGGAYTFPTAEAHVHVVSSSAADEDLGTSIFNGTSSGGTATSLIDATKNFNGGTPVEVGDCVILDKSMDGGRNAEWGYVSAITSNTELAVSGGFSRGGTGFGAAGRNYYVIDKNTAGCTGAHAIKFDYLDDDYAEFTEIIILNGDTAVDSINSNIYRVNSFRVIATGSGNKPVGALSLTDHAGTAFRSYISAGFTRARNAMYSVPAGKTLVITSWTAGYAYAQNSTHYCRIYIRGNREPSTGILTGSIFYTYLETLMSNNSLVREFEIPTRMPAKTDLKVSALADFAGVVTSALRGYLE